MKPRQLLIVIVLAVLLGGLGLYISRRQAGSFQTSSRTGSGKVLPDFPINNVAGLTLQQGTNTLTLLRKEGVWTVQERYGYPASFTKVGDFLRKVWELRAVQSEPVGDKQRARLQLVPPSGETNTGVLLSFQGADGKPVASLLLGKKQSRPDETGSVVASGGWADSRWVMGLDRPDSALLVAEGFNDAETEPDRWLDKGFFKVEKLRRIQVTHPETTNSWTLERETEGGELRLVDPVEGEELDLSKSSSAGNALAWPSFVDVIDPDAPASETGLQQPVVARLETFEGFRYTATVGAAVDSNHALRVAVEADLPGTRVPGENESDEDKQRLDREHDERVTRLTSKLKEEKAFEPWTYRVTQWTVEPLLKKRSELLKEPATLEDESGPEATPAPPE